MYKSNDIAFLAFDEEHHRIAIANTEPGVKKLGFISKIILAFRNWLNKNIPTTIGLDHISYCLNQSINGLIFIIRQKIEVLSLTGQSIMDG